MSKGKFIVPKEMQHEYKMLIQRANRRIKSNLKYITDNNIRSEHTQRSLVSGFMDPEKWAGGRMPLSRSNKGRYVWNADTEQMEFREFGSEREFKQYINYLERWGKQTQRGEYYDTHPETIKKGYKQSIIKALNEVKDQFNISLPNNQLPKEIIKELDSLSLSQITNFFEGGQVDDDLMVEEFDTFTMFKVTDARGFIDIITSRIGMLKRFR